jgi:hypothetical protein
VSAATARVFAEATRFVEDVMLLVTPAGEILAGNRAAATELGLQLTVQPNRRLAELLPQGAEESLREALRVFSGSTEPSPATLILRTAGDDGGTRHYRCDGLLFRPGSDDPPLLQLRLRPKEKAVRSFALLTRQIDDLNREILARKRFEADLGEALEAQGHLLRELQHRVGNTIQVILSLLNRELRQAGKTMPTARLRSFAARIQAIGFVQKQMAAAADLSRVEVGRLVRDIAGYLHPLRGIQGTAIEVTVEPIHLLVEVATPLALALTECLSRIEPGDRAAPSAAGIRIEGRRLVSPARLALSITWRAASKEPWAYASDPLLAAIVTQMGGLLVAKAEEDAHRLTFTLPVPYQDGG